MLRCHCNERSLLCGRSSIGAGDRAVINILQASMLAMTRAVAGLKLRPEFVYVDGNRCPKWEYPSEAVVKGDSLVPSICCRLDYCEGDPRQGDAGTGSDNIPGYGFATNMGYPTAAHLAALESLGATPIHRRTFAPVARILEAAERS